MADFDFMGGALPAGATLTRSSTAWFFNATPALASAAANVARFPYDPTTAAARGMHNEPAATNSLRNATGSGANGTATLPTNWGSGGSLAGMTRTISDVVEDGIDGVEVKYTGTPTSTSSVNVEFESRTFIAALPGQTWTASLWARLASGSLTNSPAQLVLREFGAAGALGSQSSLPLSPTGAALRTQRFDLTRTLSDAGTVSVSCYFQINYTIGVPVNCTIRLFPQLVQTATTGSPIVTTGAAAVTRTADVLALAFPATPNATIVITRASGATTLSNVAISDASYTVPTDPSPLQHVTITATVSALLAIAEALDRIAIQIAPGWPRGLPCPSVAGYSFRPAAAVDRIDLDIGAARVYRRTLRPVIEVPVTWQFDATQQTTFDRFQTLVLQEGAQWFAVSLPLPAGNALAVARFKGGVQMALLGNKRWQTTATLELLDRPVMTAAQLTAALGDGGAMAWPEGKLPCPLLAGWQIATNPATVHTADMPGLPQARRRSLNSIASAPASWELDANQAALLDAFLRWRGRDGAQWISFPLVQPSGKTAASVRFTGETEWTPRERGRWAVSAPFEIRERPV